MEVSTDSFRALTNRVDELAEDFGRLRKEALTFRLISEALNPVRAPAPAPARPRHLRAVDGGQQ